MTATRRNLLLGGAALLGAGLGFSRLLGRPRSAPGGVYGPLIPDPGGILDLPEGFSYRVLQRVRDRMSDGYRVPGSFDGMACFQGPKGTLVLMRNHENSYFAASGPYGPMQTAPPEAYSPEAMGGVTRLVLDAETLEARSSNLVLAGTLRNCAGGPSPWGYISCEETTEPGHGYAFLCRTDAARATAPVRLDGYGRFRHEAVAIEPTSSRAYLTEDREDGCLYRFVPRDVSRPFEGRLDALSLVEHPSWDTGAGLPARGPLEVTWIPLPDDARESDRARFAGRERGAALFRRGEGIWLAGREVVFCATTGGAAELGQVFRLTLGLERPDHLELLVEARNSSELNMPDNVTITPSGDIVLAEDSPLGEKYLRVLSRDGRLSDLARNAASRSELAGVCFSPDGGTLFANVYEGVTLAIRGPFAGA